MTPKYIDKVIDDNEILQKGGSETAIRYIQRDIAEIKGKLDGQYVTKDEFEPIRKLVYGLVGTILISVVGAILAIVLRK